jgi:hypothetical protein
MLDLTSHTFGIEIETSGLTREALAKTIADVIGGRVVSCPPYHGQSAFQAVGPDNRGWSVLHDGSISGVNIGEIVSPVLRYSDIETVQKIARAVFAAGGRSTAKKNCGIHIHVGAAGLTVKNLIDLSKLVDKQEELIHAALDISTIRAQNWTRPTDQGFLDRVDAKKPKSFDELAMCWYNLRHVARWESFMHLHDSRYHGLNLHSFFNRGKTVEFRLFNGTLHAGKIKSYIQFCLAMVEKARTTKGAAHRGRRTYNPECGKYDFRCFLINLGLKGDEFKTLRGHMLKNLKGDSAFKHGRAA